MAGLYIKCFKRLLICFPKWLYHFVSSSVWKFQFLHIVLMLGIDSLFNCSYLNRCGVVPCYVPIIQNISLSLSISTTVSVSIFISISASSSISISISISISVSLSLSSLSLSSLNLFIYHLNFSNQKRNNPIEMWKRFE